MLVSIVGRDYTEESLQCCCSHDIYTLSYRYLTMLSGKSCLLLQFVDRRYCRSSSCRLILLRYHTSMMILCTAVPTDILP